MKKQILLFLFSLTFSLVSYSLGLGDLKVHSYLNQPLDAEVELIDVGSMPLGSIKVDIAAVEEFEKLGMDRSYVLDLLSMTVAKKPDGKTVIYIRSAERITEPYFQLLVDLAWPTGQVYRAYTILLDPPNYKVTVLKKRVVGVSKKSSLKISTHSGVVEKETVTQVGSSEKNIQTHGELSYGPTVENESIWQIAQRYKTEDVILQQVILAIVGSNPEAFNEGNLNGLKAGQTLVIPSSSQIEKVPARLAKMEVYEQDNAWQAKRIVQHVLQPPYMDANTTESVEVGSKLPPVPIFATSNFASPLPQVVLTAPATLLNTQNSALDNEHAALQKTRYELDIASTALQSVREANILLSEQIRLLQADNKRLQSQLKQRDKTIAQLQKDVLIIRQRQGLAGQAGTAPEYESGSIWPWILLFLLSLGVVGGLGYWRYWMRREPPEEVVIAPVIENKIIIPPAEEPPPVVETAIVEEEPPVVVEEPTVEEEIIPEAEKSEEPGSLDFVPEPIAETVEEKEKEHKPEPEPEEVHALEFEPGITSVEPKEEKKENEEIKEENVVEFTPVTAEKPTKPKPTKSNKALETLLDMAKTYISMKDLEAAEEALKEVIAHGNKKQKAAAEKLLAEVKGK